MTTSQNDRSKPAMRTCIGCRVSSPQAQLIRCATGDGSAVVSRSASGRGAWLCSLDCFDKAAKRGGFARAWRTEVQPQQLAGLRIAFEAVITNMRELLPDGKSSVETAPAKG